MRPRIITLELLETLVRCVAQNGSKRLLYIYKAPRASHKFVEPVSIYFSQLTGFVDSMATIQSVESWTVRAVLMFQPHFPRSSFDKLRPTKFLRDLKVFFEIKNEI